MQHSVKVMERWLKHHGWSMIDYPYPRGHRDYSYTVYHHPDIRGVWTIDSAVEKEKERIASGCPAPESIPSQE